MTYVKVSALHLLVNLSLQLDLDNVYFLEYLVWDYNIDHIIENTIKSYINKLVSGFDMNLS